MELFQYAFHCEQQRLRHLKTSFNLSFKKSLRKGYENRQKWSNGNSHAILLDKAEWPGVMCSRKFEKNGERERRDTITE